MPIPSRTRNGGCGICWTGYRSTCSCPLEGGWINAIAFTPDGRRAISGSWDNTLKLWDLATRTCLATLHGGSSFLCVTLHENLVYAGDTAGNLWMLEFSQVEPPENVAPRRMQLFLGHAPEDEVYLKELEAHLALLIEEGLLEIWSECALLAGSDRDSVTAQRLSSADIVVLLVSSNFLPFSLPVLRRTPRAAEPDAVERVTHRVVATAGGPEERGSIEAPRAAPKGACCRTYSF